MEKLIKLHEGEGEVGETLLVFIAANTGIEEARSLLSDPERLTCITLSEELTVIEINTLLGKECGLIMELVISKSNKFIKAFDELVGFTW